MEYCCRVWAGAPSCYLELLDKLQKPIYRTFISFFVGKAKRSYCTITKEGCPNSGTRKLYHKASKAGF